METKHYLKKIGQNIKEIRKSKGISQLKLAHMCNFEKSNMSRIEAGNNNLTLKTLLKIANCLNVNPLELCETKPNP